MFAPTTAAICIMLIVSPSFMLVKSVNFPALLVDLVFLKIDKSFVTDLTNDNSARVIIETIVSMAKHLHLETVAEGVETEEQFDILKSVGCDYFQGYLFGKPGDFMVIE